jgi:hypothetical protein
LLQNCVGLGREQAEKIGYWLPWLGTPPDAPPISKPEILVEFDQLSWWQTIRGAINNLLVSTI